MDIRAAAAALDGQVAGRDQVICPGPGHSRQDRSLSVRFDPRAPEGFIVHSFAGDDAIAARDFVRARLGLPPWREQVVGADRFSRTSRRREVVETAGRLALVAREPGIWRNAVDPRGTPVEAYLKARALHLPDAVAGSVIRFLYCCPWSTDPDTNITTYVRGALLAAFRSIETNEIVAVHRMRLDQPERWPKIERKMYGPKRLAAVKLAPAGDTLAIGEGVETCLAAMQLGLGPAWALGSAGAIRDFPVLPDVSTLLILAENDATNAAALQVCGRRWRQAGRRVRAVYPEIGSDLNDVLMGTQ